VVLLSMLLLRRLNLNIGRFTSRTSREAISSLKNSNGF